jgi:hypothetical protein
MKISRKKVGGIFLSMLVLTSVVALSITACSKDESSKGSVSASATAKTIPLLGNTYVVNGPGRIIESEDGRSMSLTDTLTVYNVYFRTNVGGNLRLYLRYVSPKESRRQDEGAMMVKVGVAPPEGTPFVGDTYTIALPKSPTPTKDTAVFICQLNVGAPGYLRLDLKGVKLVGDLFKAVVADGEASQDMAYSPNGRLNSPSVHLYYELPEGKNVEWFYNEVTVPHGMDKPASYYMVDGFQGGYFGIQPSRDSGLVRVLFSVWSEHKTDNPNTIPDSLRVPCLSKGEGVTHQMFGGEGSGTQTFYTSPGWKTGSTYKCLANIYPSANIGFTDYKAVDYVAYIFDPASEKWNLVSWLRRRTDVITYYKNAYSFAEDFGGIGYMMRKACFGNQWAYVEGEWQEVLTATLGTDGTGSSGDRLDYKGGVEDGKFFIQNGSFFSDNVRFNTKFTRPATGTPPDVDFEHLAKLKEEGRANVQQQK